MSIEGPISQVFNAQELPLKIFSFLDNFKDLCVATRVCKTWNNIACDDVLWKPLFNSTYSQKNVELPAYTESFKQRFALCFINEKKWQSELEYHFFDAIEDIFSEYKIHVCKEYIAIQNITDTKRFFRLFKEDGTLVSTPPEEIAPFLNALTQEITYLQRGIRKIGPYTFSFEKDVLVITDANAKRIELKHALILGPNMDSHDFSSSDTTLRENEYMHVHKCVHLISNSSLLVTAASRCSGKGAMESPDIYMWDLSTGECINQMDLGDSARGSSLFCVHDGCLFVGTEEYGLHITNFEGKRIKFLKIERTKRRGEDSYENQIDSVAVTDNGIYALDGNGYIHIWKHKKETALAEKMNKCALGP